MSYGESIGRIKRDVSLRRDDLDSYRNLAIAQHLLHAVISSVVAGAENRHLVTIETESGDLDLYTEPPVNDTEEAHRISLTIQTRLAATIKRSPIRLYMTEVDSFTPVGVPKT